MPHQCHTLTSCGFETPSLSHQDRAAPAIRTFQTWAWTLLCPASSCTPSDKGLCHYTQLIRGLLPLDWEEQATTPLSTHPPWAAAFTLHLDLLTKEAKSCKYILKNTRTCKRCKKWLLSLNDQEEIRPFTNVNHLTPQKKKKIKKKGGQETAVA